MYHSLSVIAEESDFIKRELYLNPIRGTNVSSITTVRIIILRLEKKAE